MKFDRDKIYALALGGGGVRGAYEIGVWRALIEENINIKSVCGTSIGAVNGALVAQKDFKKAIKLWTEITPETIYNKDSNMVDRIRDISKLEEILRANLDEEKIRKSDIDFGVVTFNLTTLEPIIIFKEDMPNGKMIDYILASANYPIFYRQEIDEEVFVDGGVYDNLPRGPLADRGYKDIIEVDINPPLSNITKKKVADDVTVHTIISKHTLYGQFLFNSKQLKENINKGYLDTKLYNDEYLSSHYYVKSPMNGYDIALKPKDISRLIMDDRFSNFFISDKRIKSYIEFINDYYKDKNGYDYGDIPIRDERFFMAALEITADVVGLEPIKEYSYEEFRLEIIREVNELILNEEKISSLLDGGIFNLAMSADMNFDKKTLLSLLIFASNRSSLIESILYTTSPKITIAFITSFIIMNRLNYDDFSLMPKIINKEKADF